MNPDPHFTANLEALERGLSKHFDSPDYDMNDKPELALIEPFSQLCEGLQWLEIEVSEPWREADANAIRLQKRHGRLAMIAITGGALAIVCGIVQLALRITLPLGETAAMWVEIGAAAAAAAAVLTGIIARLQDSWLGQRHVAERLRMLKFQSLGVPDLWNGNLEGWRSWVTARVAELKGAEKKEAVDEWTKKPLTPLNHEPIIHVDASASNSNKTPENYARVLAIYYLNKRLNGQAKYFREKGLKAEKTWAYWYHHHHGPFWLFMISTVFILAHVLVHFGESWSLLSEEFAKNLGVGLLASAAALPIFGMWMRAVLSAFEYSRRVRCFASKHETMEAAGDQMSKHEENLKGVLHQIREDEAVLEQEHQEWLRIVLDSEWFL